jgi:arylsulfatase A-like enzyme
VPLIVRVPGGPQQKVVEEPVSTTDIYPTVLGALGIELPGRVDGRDLGALMLGEALPSRPIYAEALNGYDLSASTMLRKRPQDDILHCLTDGAWKLIYRPNAPEASELYDLQEDPGETRNLYGTGIEQEQRLVQALIEMDPFVPGPFGEHADEKVLERLRSLGYL